MMRKGLLFRQDLLDATNEKNPSFSSQIRHWSYIKKSMHEEARRFVNSKISEIVAAGLKSHNIIGTVLDPNELTYLDSSALLSEIKKINECPDDADKYLK